MELDRKLRMALWEEIVSGGIKLCDDAKDIQPAAGCCSRIGGTANVVIYY